MMTPSQIEIARKLVAHERWPGGKADRQSDAWWNDRSECGMMVVERIYPLENLPDLTDDATAGVLLGMWREARGLDGVTAWTALPIPTGDWRASSTTHMAELFALMLLDVWGEG